MLVQGCDLDRGTRSDYIRIAIASAPAASPFGNLFGAKKPDAPAASASTTTAAPATTAPPLFGGASFGAPKPTTTPAAATTENSTAADKGKEKERDATNTAPNPPTGGGLFPPMFGAGAKKPEDAAKPAGPLSHSSSPLLQHRR